MKMQTKYGNNNKEPEFTPWFLFGTGCDDKESFVFTGDICVWFCRSRRIRLWSRWCHDMMMVSSFPCGCLSVFYG